MSSLRRPTESATATLQLHHSRDNEDRRARSTPADRGRDREAARAMALEKGLARHKLPVSAIVVNREHHHTGLGLFTPHDVHYGLAAQKYSARAVVLESVHRAHPERFVNGTPVPLPLPTEVWINKPAKPEAPIANVGV